jgi:hypothetical protein
VRKISWLDILACLSLGNLCFLEIWNALLLYDREQSFFLHRLPPAPQYWSAACAVLILSAVLFGLLQLARWIRRRWGALWAVPVLGAMVLLPANVARNIVSTRSPDLRVRLIAALGLDGIMIIFAAGLLVLAILLARVRGRPASTVLLLIAQISPLFALEIGESLWRVTTARPADYADRPLARIQNAAQPRSRVVWIIFDELDYRLLFPDRPSTVSMPEFDRLKAQALNATAAVSPARDTLVSVPSLLTGRQLNWTKGDGPVTLYGGASPTEPLDVNSTVFSDVRRMGRNVAVAGWYLPYCRMFAESLSACSWYDNGSVLNITGDGIGENLVNQTRTLFETSLFSPFGQSLTLKHAIRMVEDFRRDARQFVDDPAFDLVFLHYPVPHAPHPYNRFSGTFTRSNAGFEGYLDSLALADVLLGEVRAEMIRVHAWDAATMIVTSDHPYRESSRLDGKSDPRVPFLVKFPGQDRSVVYDRPLHTLVTREFVDALFRGDIASPEDAVKWFCNR